MKEELLIVRLEMGAGGDKMKKNREAQRQEVSSYPAVLKAMYRNSILNMHKVFSRLELSTQLVCIVFDDTLFLVIQYLAFFTSIYWEKLVCG